MNIKFASQFIEEFIIFDLKKRRNLTLIWVGSLGVYFEGGGGGLNYLPLPLSKVS